MNKKKLGRVIVTATEKEIVVIIAVIMIVVRIVLAEAIVFSLVLVQK